MDLDELLANAKPYSPKPMWVWWCATKASGAMAVPRPIFDYLGCTGEGSGNFLARQYLTEESAMADLRQAVEKYRAAKPEVK